MLKRLTLLALILVLNSPAAPAADTAPLALEQGQWVEIAGADSPFAAILTPQRGAKAAGAILLIPDQESHPDRREATGVLRANLPEFGWTTLAITLSPAAPNGQTDADLRRIGAALAYLQQQKATRIVVIGHGRGATLAAAYLASQPQAPVAGLVALGWYDPDDAEGNLSAAAALANFTTPVYDLYGSRDLNKATRQAAERLAAAGDANRVYRQQTVEGADHDFTGLDHALVQRVRGWMQVQVLRNSPLR